MPAADEQQLILQAKEGCNGAFRHLVERYMKQAYNIAFSFVRNHEDAEDVAQEAFVRIHRSLTSFRGDSEFSTWLYRIVMNLSINRIRQRKVRVQREVQMTPFHENLSQHYGGEEQPDMQMHIERALHQLPTLQRAVVILRHINGLSTKQASGILNCTEGTIKTHLHRGLKKLKTQLQYLRDER